jgi:Cation efflux family
MTPDPFPVASGRSGVLLRRGRTLEGITLGWNVVGIIVLTVAGVRARSVALAGFGLDSLIEIGASTVVLWELSGTGQDRQRRALRLIGGAFLALAAYLTVQSVIVLATAYHPGHSLLGIGWTAVTAVAMCVLAAAKSRTGKALDNRVLVTEGRVTLMDGILAVAVLAGLVLNTAAGLWWADPLAALVIVAYALREAREISGPATDAVKSRSALQDPKPAFPDVADLRPGVRPALMGQMTQPSVRRADLFSRVRILLSTSLLAGVPVHVVSQRPGHANATISLLVYAHVMPGSQREAADLFARLVGVPRHDPGAASIRLASRGYSERGSHRRNSADLRTRWDDHSAPRGECTQNPMRAAR